MDPEGTPSTGGALPQRWADNLAYSRLRAGAGAQPDPQSPQGRSVAWLFHAFDTAQHEIDAAFVALGKPDRVLMTGSERERRYWFAGIGIHEHAYISLEPVFPVVDGHARAGVLVHMSCMSGSLYIVADRDGRPDAWISAVTTVQFGADQIHDLFLCAFGGDREASARLSAVSYSGRNASLGN